MPAKSKSQQRFFGMLHAIQNGTLSKKKVSPEMRRKAKQIDPESVRHFAETKHKNLPERKKDEDMNKDAFAHGFKAACSAYGVDARRLLKFATDEQFSHTLPITPPFQQDTATDLLQGTRFGKLRFNWNGSGVGSAKHTAKAKEEINNKYVPKQTEEA